MACRLTDSGGKRPCWGCGTEHQHWSCGTTEPQLTWCKMTPLPHISTLHWLASTRVRASSRKPRAQSSAGALPTCPTSRRSEAAGSPGTPVRCEFSRRGAFGSALGAKSRGRPGIRRSCCGRRGRVASAANSRNGLRAARRRDSPSPYSEGMLKPRTLSRMSSLG